MDLTIDYKRSKLMNDQIMEGVALKCVRAVSFPTLMLIILISMLIGAIGQHYLTREVVKTRIDEAVKVGAFLHNGSVYVINAKP